MKKKYKLTKETKEYNGHTLHRIESLEDFGFVAKGDLGGWIEKERNLSHDGNAWVSGNAIVYGDAVVSGNAWVSGNAIVYDDAVVSGNAIVCGDAIVRGDAVVSGNAWVSGNAIVCGDAIVCDDAIVYDDAVVSGNARVYGDAVVCGDAIVCDDAIVYGDAVVCGNAWVYGDAVVRGDARVYGKSDYIVFKNWWSSGRYFTWTRSNNKWSVGCFYGTGEELIRKAYADSEKSGREYERVVRYVESILRDEEKENNLKEPNDDIPKTERSQ